MYIESWDKQTYNKICVLECFYSCNVILAYYLLSPFKKILMTKSTNKNSCKPNLHYLSVIILGEEGAFGH